MLHQNRLFKQEPVLTTARDPNYNCLFDTSEIQCKGEMNLQERVDMTVWSRKDLMEMEQDCLLIQAPTRPNEKQGRALSII